MPYVWFQVQPISKINHIDDLKSIKMIDKLDKDACDHRSKGAFPCAGITVKSWKDTVAGVFTRKS